MLNCEPRDDEGFARQLRSVVCGQSGWTDRGRAIFTIRARCVTPPILTLEMQIEQQHWHSRHSLARGHIQVAQCICILRHDGVRDTSKSCQFDENANKVFVDLTNRFQDASASPSVRRHDVG
jgi:hypothetical protein